MNARATSPETSQQRADRLLAEHQATSGWHACYGHPIGHITNPLTGSVTAVYAGGQRVEIALPTCDFCDHPLDEHDYCVRCEDFSGPGVVADWPAIGGRINAAVAGLSRAGAGR